MDIMKTGTKKLIEELKITHQSINAPAGSFGTRDVIQCDRIWTELAQRGVDIEEYKVLSIEPKCADCMTTIALDDLDKAVALKSKRLVCEDCADTRKDEGDNFVE